MNGTAKKLMHCPAGRLAHQIPQRHFQTGKDLPRVAWCTAVAKRLEKAVICFAQQLRIFKRITAYTALACEPYVLLYRGCRRCADTLAIADQPAIAVCFDEYDNGAVDDPLCPIIGLCVRHHERCRLYFAYPHSLIPKKRVTGGQPPLESYLRRVPQTAYTGSGKQNRSR